MVTNVVILGLMANDRLSSRMIQEIRNLSQLGPAPSIWIGVGDTKVPLNQDQLAQIANQIVDEEEGFRKSARFQLEMDMFRAKERYEPQMNQAERQAVTKLAGELHRAKLAKNKHLIKQIETRIRKMVY